jgi:excisionase family DNA binding protein
VNDNYRTAAEVGQMWQLRRRHVVALALFGGLRYTRDGRRMLFHVSDLRAWLYAHSYEAGNGKPPSRFGMWLDEHGW